MSKIYDSKGLAEKLGGTLSDVDVHSQHPPATDLSQQWRGLAKDVRRGTDTDRNHMNAGYAYNAADALIAAADACDQLTERIEKLQRCSNCGGELIQVCNSDKCINAALNAIASSGEQKKEDRRDRG